MIVIDLDSWVWNYIAIIRRVFYRERKLEALNYYLNIYIYQSLQVYWIMQSMMFSQKNVEYYHVRHQICLTLIENSLDVLKILIWYFDIA